MLRSKAGKHHMCVQAIQLDIPGVVGIGERSLDSLDQSLLASLPTPVVNQLVSGYPISQPTVSGTSLRPAATARNVSEVRSSATVRSPQRAIR